MNFDAEGDAAWQGGWTIFYWAWWIAYGPFVGLFVTRISNGRSIRQVIFGMLIYLCLMAEAFMGYLLPWGQMSYWGAQVIISLFGAVPFIMALGSSFQSGLISQI